MITICNEYGEELSVTVWKFPGGETGLKIDSELFESDGDEYRIRVDYRSNDDLFALAQAVDAIRAVRGPDIRITLYIPYMPYARQDRRCNPGEAHALRIAAGFINSLKLYRVAILDPHSSVTSALIDNLVEIQQSLAALKLPNTYDAFLAPDAGAEKKVFSHAGPKEYGAAVYCASKRRSPNGDILGVSIPNIDQLQSMRVVVVDDICDGGATFVALAEEVHARVTVARLDLYVTHGIFSKGVDRLLSLYDNIYVSNLMNQAVKSQVKEI